MDDLRYPIGRYTPPEPVTAADRARWIQQIAELPAALQAAVAGLTDAHLDTPYRPGGWTVRQTVHHVGDSHLNALARFKLALTEDTPTIRPYDEARWAELADYALPVEVSLTFIGALHARWAHLLRHLDDAAFAREIYHPEADETMTVARLLGMYAWHGRHHLAHIERLREREGWHTAPGSTR